MKQGRNTASERAASGLKFGQEDRCGVPLRFRYHCRIVKSKKGFHPGHNQVRCFDYSERAREVRPWRRCSRMSRSSRP